MENSVDYDILIRFPSVCMWVFIRINYIQFDLFITEVLRPIYFFINSSIQFDQTHIDKMVNRLNY